MNSRKICIFETQHDLSNYLVRKWITLSQLSVALDNRFMVALCGGKSPIEFYCKLSNIDASKLWQKTHVFFTDERFVSYDHPQSNYKRIKDVLLDYVPINDENIHSIPTYCEDALIAARNYEKDITRTFNLSEGEKPLFDCVILGVGKDGHVASLFEEDKGIALSDNIVDPIYHQSATYNRMSLTLPTINNAKQVIVILAGEEKAEVAKQILVDRQLPASLISPRRGEVIFCLDSKAAKHISFQDSFQYDEEAIVINT